MTYGNNIYDHLPELVRSRPEQHSSQLWIVAGIAVIYSTYLLLRFLDVSLLSPSELLWNALVFLIPHRLVVLLAKRAGSNDGVQRMQTAGSRSEQHARKAGALRGLLNVSGWGDKAPSEVRTIGQRELARTNTTHSEIPPGLGNWDNSCYQNSVLQGLCALSSLKDFLEKVPEDAAPPSTSTLGSLREITSKLNGSEYNGKKIWTPAKLKSMSSWQQQDAQEYFSKILDEVDREILKLSMAQYARGGGLGVIANLEDSRPAQQSSKIPTQNAQDANPIEGLMAQRVACTACGFSEGLSMSPFNCLTVPLGNESDYDIEDCLDECTKLEEIPGVECASCTLRKSEASLANMLGSSRPEPSVGDSIMSLPPELRQSIVERLQHVRNALEAADFSESTIHKKCMIGKNGRVSSTKTRQAVIARSPKALVIHINRSLFDEFTGAQRKNYAKVRYPSTLSCRPWILGSEAEHDEASETWNMDPAVSILPGRHSEKRDALPIYKLRAVVTHYGRHENGHYICYRQHDTLDLNRQNKDNTAQRQKQWWRLSDEDVSVVSEDDALSQGGVFMLFYEKIEESLVLPQPAGDLPIAAEVTRPSVESREILENTREVDVIEAALTSRSDTKDRFDELATANPLDERLERAPSSDSPKGFEGLDSVVSEDSPMQQSPLRKAPSPTLMRTSRSAHHRKRDNYISTAPPITAT